MTFKPNIGAKTRILYVVAGVVVMGVAAFGPWFDGTEAWVFGVLGAGTVASGASGF